MTWVDLFLLFILACGVVAFSRKCLRKYTPIYKGIDRDFASHCALSIEESPLLQIQTAPEGALAHYLVLDTETVCYLHDTVSCNSIASIQTPLLVSLSWLLLDEQLRMVRREDHLLLTGVPISNEATDYHQLTIEYVSGHGEDPKSVLQLFLSDLEPVQMIIGHHLAFHLSVLEHDLTWYKLPSRALCLKRKFCTMHQGISYLISQYQADPHQTLINLESLYSKLFWDRDLVPIVYQLKSRHDVILATHCFIRLYSGIAPKLPVSIQEVREGDS